MWLRSRLALIACVMLAGCASMSGFPRPIIDQRQEDAELTPYVGPAAMARYDACVEKVVCRNLIIDARLHAVDLAFYRFQRKIFGQESGVSLGSNITAMALDSVAAVIATRPLAAGAKLLGGGRDAYQKQVLSASLPLLFEEMIVSRREALLRVRQGEQLPVANYSLFQALADVGEYEMAGTIPAAAAELGANAGASSRTAQARLDALRMQSVAAPVAMAMSQPIAMASPPTSAPSVAGTGFAYTPASSTTIVHQPVPQPAPQPSPVPPPGTRP